LKQETRRFARKSLNLARHVRLIGVASVGGKFSEIPLNACASGKVLKALEAEHGVK
jgi:hypothetical protein